LAGVKKIRKGKNQGDHHSMLVKKTSTFTTSYPEIDTTKQSSLDHNPEPASSKLTELSIIKSWILLSNKFELSYKHPLIL
jgi:hypothetical protein